MQDRDWYKYESFCKNAAAQMYALTQALPRGGVKDTGVRCRQCGRCHGVMPSATLGFMNRAQHEKNRLVWYATQKPEQKNIEWVNSAVPAQRILSSAHTAIVMPPEDEHYGANGTYVNCLHYYENDKPSYHACCARGPDTWLGEVTEQGLRHGVVRRLTYNPHYAAMEASMQKFIEGLP